MDYSITDNFWGDIRIFITSIHLTNFLNGHFSSSFFSDQMLIILN